MPFTIVTGFGRGEGGGRGQTIVLGENGLSRGMRVGSMELCFLVFYSGILILLFNNPRSIAVFEAGFITDFYSHCKVEI